MSPAPRRHLRVVDDVYPRHRSAPRDVPVGYRLRVTLDESSPPIWREFDIASNALLPDLHDALQTIMGWQDYHLHTFVLGNDPWDPQAVSFLPQSSVDEVSSATPGEDAPNREEPEETVRVDELLTELGDTMLYVYDFGDNWIHHICLTAVLTQPPPIARCLTGARACPPEDCGGIGGYADLLKALADPSAPEHSMLRTWAGDHDASQFSVDHINARIARNAEVKATSSTAAQSSELVKALLARTHPGAIPLFMDALIAARLHDKPDADPALATSALVKITWMIDHIGAGLKLTGSGYLPPASVAAMRTELDWGNWRFIGVGNRENNHPQATLMRETIVHLGLARKTKGVLLPTKRAEALRHNTSELLALIAARVPLGRHTDEHDAGTIALVAAAAGVDDPNPMIIDTMQALGWRADQPSSFTHSSYETGRFLWLLGAGQRVFGTPRPSPPWISLVARTALQNRVAP